VAASAITSRAPTLDDVYLRHTGRSFTEAETAAAAEQQQRTQRQEARR